MELDVDLPDGTRDDAYLAALEGALEELAHRFDAGLVIYLAGADPHDPLAAPLHADPRGLPPTYLQVGAEEALLDDTRRLAERLREAGVDVRLDEFADQVHTFQMTAGHTAVADEAIWRAGLWLRSTLVP
jgi:acetyl esterase/lipase